MEVYVLGDHMGLIGGLVFSVVCIMGIARSGKSEEEIDRSRRKIKVKVNR